MMRKFLAAFALTLLCALIFAGCENDNAGEPPRFAVETDSETEQAQEHEVEEGDRPDTEEVDRPRIVEGFGQFEPPAIGEEYAVITTDFGIIELRLFPEFAPMAVDNFVTHAKNGYYDGLVFHRIMEQFMIQTGDPLGTGFGGESIYGEGFYIEIDPTLRHFNGALAMARSRDPGSQGSQFYIVQNNKLPDHYVTEFNYIREHQDAEIEEGSGIPMSDFFPTWIVDNYIERGGVPALDFQYTVFGQVFSGMEAVNAIAAVEVVEADNGEMSKPLNEVFMNKVEIKVYGE